MSDGEQNVANRRSSDVPAKADCILTALRAVTNAKRILIAVGPGLQNPIPLALLWQILSGAEGAILRTLIFIMTTRTDAATIMSCDFGPISWEYPPTS
jgi:hypothetical protein